MNKSKVLTIHDFFEACQKEIKEGKGDRHILISSDEEGNWYHELYFLFTQRTGKISHTHYPCHLKSSTRTL